MKTVFGILLSLWSLHVLGAADPKRCSAQSASEIPVYSSDFKWNLTLDEIKNLLNNLNAGRQEKAQALYKGWLEGLRASAVIVDRSGVLVAKAEPKK